VVNQDIAFERVLVTLLIILRKGARVWGEGEWGTVDIVWSGIHYQKGSDL